MHITTPYPLLNRQHWGRVYVSAIAAGLVFAAGCSSVPPSNSRLDDARNSYQSAAASSQVNTNAASELKQASTSLDAANRASESREPVAVVDHLSYLTSQQVGIAVETAKQKAAEQAVIASASERDRVRLAARTREADNAQQDAANAKQNAANAQQSALAAQQQAEADRQAALSANLAAQGAVQQTQAAEARSRELEMLLRDMEAKQTPRGAVVSLGDVLFDTDRAELKPDAARNIRKLGDFFKKYPQRSLVIEGFTDSTGTEVHNLELSEKRARTVRDALMDTGVSLDRISARGYGEAYPVAGNETASGRQMNRRVEVVISEDGKTIAPR